VYLLRAEAEEEMEEWVTLLAGAAKRSYHSVLQDPATPLGAPLDPPVVVQEE
jgi:hypothetical protein